MEFGRKELTGDESRGLEDLEDLRIHEDLLCFLALGMLIPSFDKVMDPLFEVIAQESVEHVDQPLSWDLVQFSSVRKILVELWFFTELLHHLLDRERLIMRDVEGEELPGVKD